jgi:hypothetical protein
MLARRGDARRNPDRCPDRPSDHPAGSPETEDRGHHRGAARHLGRTKRHKLAAPLAVLATLLTTPALVGSEVRAESWQLGASADVGVPDGAAASLTLSPISLVRVQAGVSHNLVSPGVRAGITLVPLQTWVRPTVSLDLGHYWEGDANSMARRISGDASIDSPTLKRFHYDYVDAHLGLEMGRSWGTFYLHAGLSRITTLAHNLDEEIMSATSSNSTTTVTFSQDPTVTAWTPSARLGFLFYLPL